MHSEHELVRRVLHGVRVRHAERDGERELRQRVRGLLHLQRGLRGEHRGEQHLLLQLGK